MSLALALVLALARGRNPGLASANGSFAVPGPIFGQVATWHGLMALVSALRSLARRLAVVTPGRMSGSWRWPELFPVRQALGATGTPGRAGLANFSPRPDCDILGRRHARFLLLRDMFLLGS